MIWFCQFPPEFGSKYTVLVTETKPVLMVSLGVERVINNLANTCLQFICNHNYVKVREIIEDNNFCLIDVPNSLAQNICDIP